MPTRNLIILIAVALFALMAGLYPPPAEIDAANEHSIHAPPLPLVAITVDDLAVPGLDRADFDGSLIPDSVRALAGRRIRIRGEFLPSFDRHTLVFVGETAGETYSNMKFWNSPAHSYIPVTADLERQDDPTYRVGPVVVEGRLHIVPFFSIDGRLGALYEIRDATFDSGHLSCDHQPILHHGC